MKNFLSALLSLGLLVGLSVQHSAIMPPNPDKVLTANSTNTPPGCKKLASDRGWPTDLTWRSALPGAFKKLRGTEGADWFFQAKSVADVQKAFAFVREHNVRLTVISTGHDFLGRQRGRSGLRLDMAAFREPTVFATDWKCGNTLKPVTPAGRTVDDIQACKVNKQKRFPSMNIPHRNHEYRFFEKRDGFDCDRLLQLQKRQEHGPNTDTHGTPLEIDQFNIIKPNPGQQAYARVTAGMFNELFFTQADKSGLMTLGAQHGGVSVTGGWMQAGGHNPFANKLGMQVDSVMEIEVVTPDGKFQKVSQCNNPELYWALRGGGGSTFGVVTAATIKVYPTFPVVVARFFVNSTKPGIMEATAYFLQQGAKLRDQHGLQGYFYVYPGGFQSVLHMPDQFATLENARNVTEHLMKKMEEIAGAKHIEPKYYQYKTYREWYIAEMGDEDMEENGKKFLSYYDGSDGSCPSADSARENPLQLIPWAIEYPQTAQKRSLHAKRAAAIRFSQGSMRHYLDSRLLSDKHVNSVSQKQLAAALGQALVNITGVNYRGFLYGGGEQAKPAKDAMGLLPAWRDATYHFIVNAVPGSIRRDYNIHPIAKLFPDAGGYVNEAASEEPDWKRVYWGSNYQRLEVLKKKYDPDNLLWCVPCVGADMLAYDDERICKNPAYPQPGAASQTYPNAKSTIGIASLPGSPGIPNPVLPLVQQWMRNKTLPAKMLTSSYFKIAMGEGGSALGRFANQDPYNPGKQMIDTSFGYGQSGKKH